MVSSVLKMEPSLNKLLQNENKIK